MDEISLLVKIDANTIGSKTLFGLNGDIAEARLDESRTYSYLNSVTIIEESLATTVWDSETGTFVPTKDPPLNKWALLNFGTRRADYHMGDTSTMPKVDVISTQGLEDGDLRRRLLARKEKGLLDHDRAIIVTYQSNSKREVESYLDRIQTCNNHNMVFEKQGSIERGWYKVSIHAQQSCRHRPA